MPAASRRDIHRMTRVFPNCISKIRVEVSVSVGEAMFIGRHRRCSLWYADPCISRRHARFDANQSSNGTLHVTLTSLSRNGVWLVRRRNNPTQGHGFLYKLVQGIAVPIRVGDLICLRNPLRRGRGFHATYIFSLSVTN